MDWLKGQYKGITNAQKKALGGLLHCPTFDK